LASLFPKNKAQIKEKQIALAPNTKDTLQYKYGNIWKLQADGSYKVLIDTYNDVR